MAGYDISASYSRSLTNASRAGEGDFTVTGSNRFPQWLIYVLLAAGAFLLWKFFFKR